MKKLILLLLCGVFVSLLGACGNNFGTSDLSTKQSEISDEPLEPSGETYVVATYRFSSWNEYQEFYNEFIKLNQERYYLPKITNNSGFDTLTYKFEAAPVLSDIAVAHEYIGVDFPDGQEMTFSVSKVDKLENGSEKSLTISGMVFDVSDENLVGNNVEMVSIISDKKYNILLGDVVLCSLEIDSIGYDNKAEYLNLIESGFNYMTET